MQLKPTIKRINQGRCSLSKKYNQVYEKLVKSQNDYTGMIAYCIYKNEKRKWISEGHDADEFVKLKLMTHELAKYKKAADSLLSTAYQANADVEVDKIKKSLANEMITIATHSLDNSKASRFKNWHHSGAAGVFGNFYSGLIIAVLVWIFSSPESWRNALASAKSAVINFFSTAFG